jgi:hypothetical protein
MFACCKKRKQKVRQACLLGGHGFGVALVQAALHMMLEDKAYLEFFRNGKEIQFVLRGQTSWILKS